MIGLARSAVTNMARRGIATSRTLCQKEAANPGYNKTIKAKQEKFGTEDGVPVFIKGGVVDSILYGATMALCVVAVGYECVFFYDIAQR